MWYMRGTPFQTIVFCELFNNLFEDRDKKSIVYTFNGLYHSRSVFYWV